MRYQKPEARAASGGGDDLADGADKLGHLRRRHPPDHGQNLLLRGTIQRRECGTAGIGQFNHGLTAIVRRGRTGTGASTDAEAR